MKNVEQLKELVEDLKAHTDALDNEIKIEDAQCIITLCSCVEACATAYILMMRAEKR